MPPAKRQDFNESDIRIAIGIAILGSREKAADFANCSERTVFNRQSANPGVIRGIIGMVEEAMRLRRKTVAEVKVERQIEELSKLYGKALAVAEEALEKGDYEMARTVIRESIDRSHGKARQTIQVDGQVNHVHVLPPEVSAAIQMLGPQLKLSEALYLPPPAEEADVVITPESTE